MNFSLARLHTLIRLPRHAARALAVLIGTMAVLIWLDGMPRIALPIPGWLWLWANGSLVLTALVIARARAALLRSALPPLFRPLLSLSP